jgi:hypothetical protein
MKFVITVNLSTPSLSNVERNLVLVDVHLLLDLLLQTLLLLVLRFRAAGDDARLLLLMLVAKRAGARNARFLVLMSKSARGRAGNASGLSSTNVACCVSAGGGTCGEARVDAVGLHALTLDVRVLTDLLAASGGDGGRVDAVIGLRHCNGATATERRVLGAEGRGHAAAGSLAGNGLVKRFGVGCGVSGAGGDRRSA